MTSAAEIHALVLTQDPWLATTFTDVARELGIEAQRSAQAQGVPEELGRTKYEAVLLDFDTIADTRAILASLRGNPSNKNAVVFAVATGASQKQQALDNGTNIFFERPLSPQEIRRTLYATYELMTRERRRYFRCSVEIPVHLTRRAGADGLVGKTINVSSSGLAVSSSTTFSLAERLEIALMLQEVGSTILACGQVVWDDGHGKTGISFDCADPEMQKELDNWLDARFLRVLQISRSRAIVDRAADVLKCARPDNNQ